MKLISSIKSKGFSLLELLVAIFLGALVVTAVYSLFVMQNKSFINQNVVSDMQQNVRMTMNILSSEFRMAGFGFSINGDYKTTAAATPSYAITPTNSTSGPDSVNLQYGINPSVLTSALASSTTSPMSVSSISGFAQNDFVIVSDGQNASRLQISATPTGNTIPFTTVSPSNFPTGGFGVGSRVYKLREVEYRVSNNVLQSREKIHSVWQAWQDVANNIEDLQLAYQGIDTPSGTWLDNPSPVNRTTITDVQINILARGGIEDLQFTGQRPLLRDHPAGSTDHFRRRPLTSTIRMRNL
jgi:prepilin-type N-terminal cleavage/methylation domain-containing protein